MKELHELREMLCEGLKEYGKKGELTAGSLSTIDTLAHALKNLDKVMEDDDGYSGYYPYDGRVYRGSYARKRDSMGRYSGEHGYSRTDIKEKLRELMNDSDDDRSRDEIKRLIDRM